MADMITNKNRGTLLGNILFSFHFDFPKWSKREVGRNFGTFVNEAAHRQCKRLQFIRVDPDRHNRTIGNHMEFQFRGFFNNIITFRAGI